MVQAWCLLFLLTTHTISSTFVNSETQARSLVIEIQGECETMGQYIAHLHGYRVVAQVRHHHYHICAPQVETVRSETSESGSFFDKTLILGFVN